MRGPEGCMMGDCFWDWDKLKLWLVFMDMDECKLKCGECRCREGLERGMVG